MGFLNSGQSSLKNNRSLRENNRWKFEGADYPMATSYDNSEKRIDKTKLKAAEGKKIRCLIMEYIITPGIVTGILFYIFLKF